MKGDIAIDRQPEAIEYRFQKRFAEFIVQTLFASAKIVIGFIKTPQFGTRRKWIQMN
jgi:hypothetical protein